MHYVFSLTFSNNSEPRGSKLIELLLPTDYDRVLTTPDELTTPWEEDFRIKDLAISNRVSSTKSISLLTTWTGVIGVLYLYYWTGGPGYPCYFIDSVSIS